MVNNCSGVEVGLVALCLNEFYCIWVEADRSLKRLRLSSRVPANLYIETIRLYPENGAYGGQYYLVEINRTLPISHRSGQEN